MGRRAGKTVQGGASEERRSAPPRAAWQASLEELLGIDTRGLAFLRVALGALLIADLIKRSLTLAEHYTDAGVLPRETARMLLPDPSIFRMYYLGGSFAVQSGLFLVAGLLAGLLLLGLETRAAAIVSLYCLVSIQARNPLACHTGDYLLTVLLFWSVFLPLGSAGSIDRLRAGSAAPPRRVVSLATAALLLQVAIFYAAAGLHKHRFPFWRDGDALGIFLGIETYATDFGAWLAGYPMLGRVLTYATLVLECAGPILLFCPFRTALVRTVMVAVLIGFHVGINLSVHIGLFEVISIAAVTVFLPPRFWDWIARRPVIRKLAATWGTRLRRLVASSPVKGGHRRPGWLVRTLVQATVAASLLLVLTSNWLSLSDREVELPRPLYRFAQGLQLLQKWDIFADLSSAPRGWFSLLGQLEDGTLVDVMRRQVVTRSYRPPRPEHFSAIYANHNQRRYWHHMASDYYRAFRPDLARYLCAEWNRGDPRRLVRIGVLHTQVPGYCNLEPVVRVIYQGSCEGP